MVRRGARKQRKPHICICIPAYVSISPKFLNCILGVINYNQNIFITEVIVNQTNPIDKARNEMVQTSLRKGAEYIFFLDSDNIIAPQTIERLMEVMRRKKADLASALYFTKSKPHYPLIRKYKAGTFWKVENTPLNEVIEVDAVGMGTALIKTDVFRRLNYPWFTYSYEKWGDQEIQMSEDICFCRKMMEAGMRMVCDTGVISSHVGSVVDVHEYVSFSSIRQSLMDDRTECEKDIMDFTGEDEETVLKKIAVGPKLMEDEWNEKNPSTSDDIRKFYKNTGNYLYDLALWHFTERRNFDNDLVSKIATMNPKRVLDYGCGIGQNAYMLAGRGINVTIADLGSKTLDFAVYRFRKHNMPHKVWRVDSGEKAPEDKYDVILCFDVLEHLPKDELRETVRRLIKLKHKGTQVLITTSFGKGEGHPMHMEADTETGRIIQKLIESHG